MSLQGPKTRELFNRAKAVIPHGVNSNFRYWGEEDTLIIDRGEGAYIWDMDGKRYIDYRLAFGPVILGHADPDVVAALQRHADEVSDMAARGMQAVHEMMMQRAAAAGQ